MTTGTGKHGHKDSQEPWPHDAQTKSGEQGGSQSSSKGSDPSESLQAREYKDEQGNVRHHTKTYMEQHDKKE